LAPVLVHREMEFWQPCYSSQLETKTMSKKRKYYTPEEKVRLLKEHLVNGKSVSELCDEHQLQPTVFYRWQRQFFSNGAAAFQNDQDREATRLKKQVAKLEEKVTKKNEVLGELMEEHLALKKNLGEA
jgi:transposase-like protein